MHPAFVPQISEQVGLDVRCLSKLIVLHIVVLLHAAFVVKK